ncbi:MAG: hypothetical protein R2709_10705 [Marmoricola sp.]
MEAVALLRKLVWPGGLRLAGRGVAADPGAGEELLYVWLFDPTSAPGCRGLASNADAEEAGSLLRLFSVIRFIA